MPSMPSLPVRSLSNANDSAIVTAGDSEMIGKIRYGGPTRTAWNSSSCPPAPSRPIARPSATARGRRFSPWPLLRRTTIAGGIMVSAQTT